MKSVGEVMAIGSNFQESLQKALCSMEEDLNGLNSVVENTSLDNTEEIQYELTFPGPQRLFYVADAIRSGWSLEKIYKLTKIDYWFLDQINEIIAIEKNLSNLTLNDLDENQILHIKEKGYSDSRIAEIIDSTENEFREFRKSLGIKPIYRRVDTCAAEFATSTCYMYSTYGDVCESKPSKNKKILVLGSGPNRIGQGIEFDYCCVHASMAMQEEGYESIMVNCNPETVSTDYDVSNRLYFEPITSEKILDIIDNESPEGVIIQFGGQTPLKLADILSEKSVKIFGTDVDAIDRSEDRERFQELVIKLGLKQPSNATVKNIDEALVKADEIGFPIVVRPSYVLGGRAMQLVHNIKELEKYLTEAVEVSNSKPILLDSYLTDAIEIDVDVVSDGNNIEIGGILQHIEQAGIHSGDSACSLPPYSLSGEIQDELSAQSILIAKELSIVGLMNIQFAVKDDVIYIIEVNPRASRTVPFISKAIGKSLVKVASKAMVGKSA
jgi:carbamoyl-phosphate synthase large subunit